VRGGSLAFFFFFLALSVFPNMSSPCVHA
jgi:hypothetical protein